jgi:hypothetical protein
MAEHDIDHTPPAEVAAAAQKGLELPEPET